MARHHPRDIKDFYEIGRRVTPSSAGGAAEVLLCTRKEDGKVFAVKKICKWKNSLEGAGQVKAMMHVEHPHVVKLVDWFEDEELLYIIMELARGGDMCDKIMAEKRLLEGDAAIYFRQILTAVQHIHTKGIVHADIKPENILYEDEEFKNIKLADFGFAQFIGEGPMMHCGTKAYSAPEIREERHFDTMADMWSLGILLYTMLSGGPPFAKPVLDHDGRVNLNFNYKAFQTVSPAAIDLIRNLIVYNPKQRLTAHQALRHRWFTEKLPAWLKTQDDEHRIRRNSQHNLDEADCQKKEDEDHKKKEDSQKKDEEDKRMMQEDDREIARMIVNETLVKIYDRFIE